ncbi:hypothetical protein ACVWZ4_000691 [Bradyrhizobium sp. USDA 4472]
MAIPEWSGHCFTASSVLVPHAAEWYPNMGESRPKAPIRLQNVNTPIHIKRNNRFACHWIGGFAVTYTSKWETLSAAADRLAKASGCSQEQARSDVCCALSDGVIALRAKLARHPIRLLTSTEVICGKQLEIPTDLKPNDIDWQDSRPEKPWCLRDHPRLHHGPWYLERIELSTADVTAKLLPEVGPTASPSAPETDKRPKRKQRESTQLKNTQDAINNLWKDVPPQHVLPNALLDRRVNAWLKEHGRREVSRDTILRAAGRR